MAVSAPTIRATFATDAEFREWVTAVHNALVAVGMTQTADTGQIDRAAVAKPAAVSTAAGYEIFRFSDALQATAPVFIKVEYGSSNGSAARPALWVTVASGTNGAGTVSGQASARSHLAAGADPAPNPGLCRFSGSTNRLTACLYAASTQENAGIFLCIERTHDGNGDDTGEGVLMLVSSGNTDAQVAVPFPSGAAASLTSNAPAAAAPWNDAVTSGAHGADVATFNIYPPPRFSLFPFKDIVVYAHADIVQDTQISLEPYNDGEAIGYRAAGAAFATTPNVAWRLAYRYD